MRESGEVGLSAGRVEHGKINENEHVRQDRAREAKPERLRSAMRALGSMRASSIERGHCRSPYPSPPLRRPRLVVVYPALFLRRSQTRLARTGPQKKLRTRTAALCSDSRSTAYALFTGDY